jgi:hypothetical protein
MLVDKCCTTNIAAGIQYTKSPTSFNTSPNHEPIPSLKNMKRQDSSRQQNRPKRKYRNLFGRIDEGVHFLLSFNVFLLEKLFDNVLQENVDRLFMR